MKTRLTSFAKKLRHDSTDAERVLWYRIRAHRLNGQKFKRQEAIGSYIVDFVCHEAKIAVELDGSQHFESASDKQRDGWLTSQGFQVLRFWDNEVLTNIEGVLETIASRLSPSPQPSPIKGEGAVKRGKGIPFSLRGRAVKRGKGIPFSPRGRAAKRGKGIPLSPRGRGARGEGV